MSIPLGTLVSMNNPQAPQGSATDHSNFEHVDPVQFEDALARFKSLSIESGTTATIARAPGRLDVLGGVADYSGSLVMEGTLAVGTWVAMQPATHGEIRISSVTKSGTKPFSATVPLSMIVEHRTLVPIEKASANLTSVKSMRWTAYLVGTIYLLLSDGFIDLADFNGCNLFVYSDVPIGAGVSSSAALEVAAARAVAGAYRVDIDGMSLASLCQRVENTIVGAPCGLMDQVTCCLGREGALLELDCRPHNLLGYSELPKDWKIVGIDSGVKHSVGGISYGKARTAAFMGLEILRQSEVSVGDYLCNLDAESWNDAKHFLPEVISAADFENQYGLLSDPVSKILNGENYYVRSCAEHPILENIRVRRLKEILSATNQSSTIDQIMEAGELMLESHRSYSDRVQLGCEETDILVSIAMSYANHGIHGAKITGGGSGGTVAVLGYGDIENIIEEIRKEYTSRTGRQTQKMDGSSPGAWAFGVISRKI